MYGDLGLYEVFEMREECLREFGFADAYRCFPTFHYCADVLGPCVHGQQAAVMLLCRCHTW